jgi:hypothetical protein
MLRCEWSDLPQTKNYTDRHPDVGLLVRNKFDVGCMNGLMILADPKSRWRVMLFADGKAMDVELLWEDGKAMDTEQLVQNYQVWRQTGAEPETNELRTMGEKRPTEGTAAAAKRSKGVRPKNSPSTESRKAVNLYEKSIAEIQELAALRLEGMLIKKKRDKKR